MGLVEKRAYRCLGKKKEELRSKDLKEINSWIKGIDPFKKAGKKTSNQLKKRFRRYIVENHALEHLKVKREGLNEKHKEKIEKIEPKDLEKTGLKMDKDLESLLTEAKKELHKAREENQLLKLIGKKRNDLKQKETDKLIHETTTEDWEEKYNQKISRTRLVEIKKRLKFIKNNRRPGRKGRAS